MKVIEQELQNIIQKYGLLNKSREQKHVDLRQEFAYFCYERIGLNKSETARLLGKQPCTMVSSIEVAKDKFSAPDNKLYLSHTHLIREEMKALINRLDNKKSVAVELATKIFELKDMDDVEKLKSWVNDNRDKII